MKRFYKKLGTLTAKRNDFEYSLYQMFSKKYIDGLINHLGAKVLFIERDLDFEPFDNNLLKDLKMFQQPKLLEKCR